MGALTRIHSGLRSIGALTTLIGMRAVLPSPLLLDALSVGGQSSGAGGSLLRVHGVIFSPSNDRRLTSQLFVKPIYPGLERKTNKVDILANPLLQPKQMAFHEKLCSLPTTAVTPGQRH